MAEDRKNVNEEALDDEDFITLEFENGEEIECEIMGIFDVEDKEYIALLPDDGTDDVYLYGYKEINDEEFELVDILDDDEFDKVAAVFNELDIEEE
jgi:uncharacterized protein YrzB (UPF0473 family)